MKITDRNPIGQTGPARSAGKAAAAAPAAGAAAPEAPAAPRTVEDAATVFGIPEDELTPSVRRGISRLLAEVEHLRTQLEQREQRIAYLERLADEDPLGPILNRRAFVREMSRMMAFSERYGSGSSVLFFDVDDMKRINDTYGHGAGDAALSHVATVLLANVRSSDVVGRLGGDEFGVLLAQTSESMAANKAAELAEFVQTHPFAWNGMDLAVSISFGIFGFDGSAEPQEVLDAADQSMYRQKRSQRDQRDPVA